MTRSIAGQIGFGRDDVGRDAQVVQGAEIGLALRRRISSPRSGRSNTRWPTSFPNRREWRPSPGRARPACAFPALPVRGPAPRLPERRAACSCRRARRPRRGYFSLRAAPAPPLEIHHRVRAVRHRLIRPQAHDPGPLERVVRLPVLLRGRLLHQQERLAFLQAAHQRMLEGDLRRRRVLAAGRSPTRRCPSPAPSCDSRAA